MLLEMFLNSKKIKVHKKDEKTQKKLIEIGYKFKEEQPLTSNEKQKDDIKQEEKVFVYDDVKKEEIKEEVIEVKEVFVETSKKEEKVDDDSDVIEVKKRGRKRKEK